jgi:hypothetical protein
MISDGMKRWLDREAVNHGLRRNLLRRKHVIKYYHSSCWPYGIEKAEDPDLCNNPSEEELKTYHCRTTNAWPGPDPQPASAWHAMTRQIELYKLA